VAVVQAVVLHRKAVQRYGFYFGFPKKNKKMQFFWG